MSTHAFRRLLLWAAVGLVVASCSDSSTEPSINTPDLSALLAELSAPILNSTARSMSPTAGMVTMTMPPIDPSRCPYSATTEFFVCPTVDLNGITITRMFRLIDATGNSQSKVDAQTSAIEMINTAKGTPKGSSFPSRGTLTIDDSSDMTLSGVRTDKHTLNGYSALSMVGTVDFDNMSIPTNNTMTEIVANVVLPNPKAGQRWPQSGTITIDDTSDLNSIGSNESETMHLVMTFNGTNIVTVSITDSMGTVTCHFDMAAQAGAGAACS